MLTWRAWPLLQRPILGGAAAILVAGTIWGVWSWTESALLCAFATCVLAVSLGPFFVPTWYRLTPEGLHVVRWLRARHRSWSEFRSVHRAGQAVVLSPVLARRWWPGREETLFLNGNGDEVCAYVEEMVVASAHGDRG
jgi:hypothetical protein